MSFFYESCSKPRAHVLWDASVFVFLFINTSCFINAPCFSNTHVFSKNTRVFVYTRFCLHYLVAEFPEKTALIIKKTVFFFPVADFPEQNSF